MRVRKYFDLQYLAKKSRRFITNTFKIEELEMTLECNCSFIVTTLEMMVQLPNVIIVKEHFTIIT